MSDAQRGDDGGRRTRVGARRASRASLVLAVSLASLVTHAAIATADVPAGKPPLQVERRPCRATSLDDVTAILRVELLGRLDEGAPRADAYRTVIDCTDDAVTIAMGVAGGPSGSRRASLAGAPANVRSRIVALTVAELARDLDHTVVPPPPPPAPIAPAPQERADAHPHGSRAVTLGAFAQSSTFRFDGVWLTGGGLRFDYAYRRFAVGLDAAAVTTNETFALGTARVVLAYGSPYVAWRERLGGRVQTRLGGGFAFGAARLNGHASDARALAGSLSGPWSAPYAFAALDVELFGGVSADVRAEGGGVTSPVIGGISGAPNVTLDGLWASVQLGLAIAM